MTGYCHFRVYSFNHTDDLMVSTSAEEGFIVQKLKLLQGARAKEAKTQELGTPLTTILLQTT